MNSVTAKPFAEHGLPLALLLITVLFWLVFMGLVIRDAALPDAASDTVIVVFPPTQPTHDIYGGILRAHGQVVQNTWFDNIWLVRSATSGFVGRLKAEGAWAAFSPVAFQATMIGGCFAGAVLQ